MSTPPQLGVCCDTLERAFQYVLDVPFPGEAGVPVEVKVLYGSTCNDICRVTVVPAAVANTAGVAAEAEADASRRQYFIKSCRGVKRGEILLEAGGLALLHAAGLPVPGIVQVAEVGGTAYLIELFIDSGRGTGGLPVRRAMARDEAAAGMALAHLHRRRSPDGRFGCRRVVASLNVGDVVVPDALWTCFDGVAATQDAAMATAAEAYTSMFVWSTSWPDLYLQHLVQPQVDRATTRGLWSAGRQRMLDVFAERFRAHFVTRGELAQAQAEELAEEGGPNASATHASSDLTNVACDSTALAKHADAEPRNRPVDARHQVNIVDGARRGDADTTDCRDLMNHASGRASPAPQGVPFPECSLLHGDLWGGNLMFDAARQPRFIDPQPLYGDREVDIAMTQFFGGFGAAFYAAYEAAYPLAEDAEMRVPWYQLYYILMHLNLFGEAYGRATEEALQAV